MLIILNSIIFFSTANKLSKNWSKKSLILKARMKAKVSGIALVAFKIS